MNLTHYQKLGVNKNADQKTLLTHLKIKIEQITQEHGNHSTVALEKIDDLLDSYNILKNPNKKQQYDYLMEIQRLSRLEQIQSKKLLSKINLYIMMYNPPPFRIYNEDGNVLITGYYIPKEHRCYFTQPVKAKIKRHYHEQ